MGRYDESRRGVMFWQSTLGAMKSEGTRLRRVCSSPCSFYEDVDIDLMIATLGGPRMTVWDTEPPCEVCGRRTHYLASPGPGSVFRPLLSVPPDAIVPLPIEAWMAGWVGRRS
jgi:hypothetical protein